MDVIERISGLQNEIGQSRRRIAELEAELVDAASAIEAAYGGLPSDKFPGPPTLIVEHMRAVARRKQ